MASRFWVGGTGTWDASDTTHWAATSGGAGGQSVPGPGDTVTFDGSSGGGTVTLGYNPSVTSITMGTFTGTLNFGSSSPTMRTFSASGTAIRGLTMGSGSWTITGNNGNIWDFNTITNLTFNRGTAVINCTYSGSVGTRSFFINLPTVRPYRVNITAGTDTIDFSSGNFEDLDFTGFSGTLDTDAFTVAGNLTLSPTMTIPTSANALTFTATTTGKTITMNGVAFNRPITFNGVGGGWTLQDNLNMSGASDRTLTLTNGTLDTNGKDVNCGFFNCSNSNIRTLTMTSGTWTVTGSNAIIWTFSTSTNLTFNGGATINFTYAGSTGTRTITGSSSVRTGPVNFTAGSDTISQNNLYTTDLSYVGFTGTLTFVSGSTNISGNLTMGTGMTVTSTTITVNMTATTTGKTVTSNGVAINVPITFNGTGGGWTLQDNLDMSGASARALTLTNGSFDANNFNVTCGSFSSSNSNTRSLTMGSGTWTLSGTGTVWSCGTTIGMTFSGSLSTIIITDTSSSSKTFTCGANMTSYGTVTISPGGTGTIFFTNTKTFTTFNCIGPNTLTFTSGTTTTVSPGGWYVNGYPGQPVTIAASTPGSAFTLSVASGSVVSHNISLQDSTATGGATFNAINSTNVSGNTGWNFIFGRSPVYSRVAVSGRVAKSGRITASGRAVSAAN